MLKWLQSLANPDRLPGSISSRLPSSPKSISEGDRRLELLPSSLGRATSFVKSRKVGTACGGLALPFVGLHLSLIPAPPILRYSYRYSSELCHTLFHGLLPKGSGAGEMGSWCGLRGQLVAKGESQDQSCPPSPIFCSLQTFVQANVWPISPPPQLPWDQVVRLQKSSLALAFTEVVKDLCFSIALGGGGRAERSSQNIYKKSISDIHRTLSLCIRSELQHQSNKQTKQEGTLGKTACNLSFGHNTNKIFFLPEMPAFLFGHVGIFQP